MLLFSTMNSLLSIKIVVNIVFAITTMVAGALVVKNYQESFTTELQINPQINYSLKIDPTINLDKELIACLQDSNSFKASISKPSGSNFSSNQRISYAANVSYSCEQLVESKLEFEWKLNGLLLSEAKEGVISPLPAGQYTLELQVKYANDYGDWQALDKKTLKIKQQQPQAVNKSPNTPIITSPLPGEYDYGNSVRTCGFKEYCIEVYVAGSASDPEDGELTGNSLNWYFTIGNGAQQSAGSGVSNSFLVPFFVPDPIKITLKATDSKGATSESSIIINLSY